MPRVQITQVNTDVFMESKKHSPITGAHANNTLQVTRPPHPLGEPARQSACEARLGMQPYVCMYACMHVRIHACMHAHLRIRIYIYIYIYKYAN